MDDIELSTQEQLQAMKDELDKIKEIDREQKQFELLREKLIPFIEQQIIKYFTYFSQYMKNKDVDLSKLMTLNTPQVITGYKQFTQPIQADKFIKTGGTDNQLLLASVSTSDIDQFYLNTTLMRWAN